VSFPANIISDFLLNTDSHIKPSHQLGLADIGYVIQILVFDLVCPHRLREQSKTDPLAYVLFPFSRRFYSIYNIFDSLIGQFLSIKSLKLTVLFISGLLCSFLSLSFLNGFSHCLHTSHRLSLHLFLMLCFFFSFSLLF
jgi:hypothetical protein